MRKLIIIVLYFFCQNINCQEYHFDYMSTYEYRLHENDTVSGKFIILGNSTSENYVLRILIENNKIRYESIIDFTKNKDFQIHNISEELDISGSLLVDKGRQLDVIDCDNYTNKYNVEYENDNGVKVIKITRFKNKKKTKIINECIIYTKPTNITKNQHFCFPQLIFPLRCNKFKLQNEDVFSDVNFIENNKELHFYKLTDFKSIDFNIKI